MTTSRPALKYIGLCIVLSMVSLRAVAADTSNYGIASWPAVSDARLDLTRGGFDFGNGLEASLGIDRVVYINGNLVTSTHLNISNMGANTGSDIGQLSSMQTSALAVATGTVNLVQNGPGNSFDPSALSHAAASTVIQNTLDHQNIQSLTTLNVAVNTLNAFRSLGLQDSLQSAQIHSLGH
ncbi:hypothetical protein [Dyella tabacisoli]|uniref:Choice-of-anchor A family protein n=1 Tax=Dyella tabacisoli TaxID=2282381 RepID=A0A369UYT7_9GAMM|nr:hypothetical protein [Dyella tabacisoli]RDD83499.1 hypothetical protein DVJ77_02675 [Dyella tabacisoli]